MRDEEEKKRLEIEAKSKQEREELRQDYDKQLSQKDLELAKQARHARQESSKAAQLEQYKGRQNRTIASFASTIGRAAVWSVHIVVVGVVAAAIVLGGNELDQIWSVTVPSLLRYAISGVWVVGGIIWPIYSEITGKSALFMGNKFGDWVHTKLLDLLLVDEPNSDPGDVDDL